MLDSILDSLFGNKTVTKKVVSSNVSDRTKKRKSIIRKFKNVDPNDNLKRARIAKELLNVSRAEGERRAARKFYKDEIEANSEYLVLTGWLYNLTASDNKRVYKFAVKAMNIISDIAKQEDSHRRKVKQLLAQIEG